MGRKQLVISDCKECPHFDYEYYMWEEVCEKLGRKVKADDTGDHQIPSDCPLQDADD